MSKRFPRTCVSPAGSFRYGVHKPDYSVTNLRERDFVQDLGEFSDGQGHSNAFNFPDGEVAVERGDWIYEIPNAFPFRGATFICRSWAEARAAAPETIALPPPPATSLSTLLKKWHKDDDAGQAATFFSELPEAVLMALAANSTDPVDLIRIAELCCEFIYKDKKPVGLRYRSYKNERPRAVIRNHELFEVVVNNFHLPNTYKELMVLRPGVQGDSEIMAEWWLEDSHIFEYLRRNSYIPWGHYAANMANDTIRYRLSDLNLVDMNGLRHLYYQRTFVRLAELLTIPLPSTRKGLTAKELEELRLQIIKEMNRPGAAKLNFSSTLWGWNYGFDCAANGYRLHASHQMIHQQFAMLPDEVKADYSSANESGNPPTYTPYGCGDLVADFCAEYGTKTESSFFDDYLMAIRSNQRLDGRSDLESSLIIHEDANVLLFVPKAQTSQWELQLMTIKPVGNIVEADQETRQSLNLAILIAMKTLTGLGAKMISSIEFPKRLQKVETGQRLLYSFLPKLPYSPGAFSEAQLRWINSHYPEDFARACRRQLSNNN